ncbi:MAG: peptidase [Rhizobacter sp.]|nr:peptidase [Rhizobacter sp.]
MRRASRRAVAAGLVAGLACFVTSSFAAAGAGAAPEQSCARPVFLTFDTGHMEIAPLVADVLERQNVRVTFFLANEKTKTGGSSLDDQWAPWWKARAAEGNAFGTHTFDHVYWLADRPGGFRMKPTAGPQTGLVREFTQAQYCEELTRSATRFKAMTGHEMSPIFRAPGGKISPALLASAKACGFTHVPWSAAGFLGDELSSERWSNAQLLEKALRDIRPGDILLAHLGIWDRHDPWAPADLEPLIVGLKARGFCFETLAAHPQYRQLIR